jgi:hypothetical protein
LSGQPARRPRRSDTCTKASSTSSSRAPRRCRAVVRRDRSAGADTDVGVGTWALAYLAAGDEEEALHQLESAAEKARNHETDQGYLHLMNLKMTFLADPRIEEPRFAAVLSRVRGD